MSGERRITNIMCAMVLYVLMAGSAMCVYATIAWGAWITLFFVPVFWFLGALMWVTRPGADQ